MQHFCFYLGLNITRILSFRVHLGQLASHGRDEPLLRTILIQNLEVLECLPEETAEVLARAVRHALVVARKFDERAQFLLGLARLSLCLARSRVLLGPSRFVDSQHIYRGTSLTRKRTPLGPFRRPMPRVLGKS